MSICVEFGQQGKQRFVTVPLNPELPPPEAEVDAIERAHDSVPADGDWQVIGIRLRY